MDSLIDYDNEPVSLFSGYCEAVPFPTNQEYDAVSMSTVAADITSSSLKDRKAEEALEAKRRMHATRKFNSRMQMKRVHSYLHKPNTGFYGPNSVIGRIVFVCIDIEAWEFDQNTITEIGVSTLDTVSLFGINPSDWSKQIKSYHYRIQENQHRINKVHVQGCPDKFNFGVSDTLRLQHAVQILRHIFEEFAVKPILVGHNIDSDIKYVAKLGLALDTLVSDCIDTENLYRATHRQPDSKSLGKLLDEYGIHATNLHNAGNDARYTLEAMLAIASRDRTKRPTPEQWEAKTQEAIRKAVIAAELKVRDQMEGWSSDSDDEPFADQAMGLKRLTVADNRPAFKGYGGRQAVGRAGGTGGNGFDNTNSGRGNGRPNRGRGGNSGPPQAARQEFIIRAGRNNINANSPNAKRGGGSRGGRGGNQSSRRSNEVAAQVT